MSRFAEPVFVAAGVVEIDVDTLRRSFAKCCDHVVRILVVYRGISACFLAQPTQFVLAARGRNDPAFLDLCDLDSERSDRTRCC